MSTTVILIGVLIITFLLGRYAILEGHRVEEKKKFTKNMNKRNKI